MKAAQSELSFQTSSARDRGTWQPLAGDGSHGLWGSEVPQQPCFPCCGGCMCVRNTSRSRHSEEGELGREHLSPWMWVSLRPSCKPNSPQLASLTPHWLTGFPPLSFQSICVSCFFYFDLCFKWFCHLLSACNKSNKFILNQWERELFWYLS